MRNSRGNVTLCCMVITCCLLGPALAFLLNLTSLFYVQNKLQTSVDAASLAIAADLSRIVISDPYWGYTSLSDYPASGESRLAADGKPLPVWGLNTALATARQESLIARYLANDYLLALAHRDATEARRAALNVSTVLDGIISGRYKGPCEDFAGGKLKFGRLGRSVLEKNLRQAGLNGCARLIRSTVSIGYLEHGAMTTTLISEIPGVPTLCEKTPYGKRYRSFVDTPVDDESFVFAGVSDKTSLIDASKFVRFDGRHVSSVVQLDAEFEYLPPFRNASENASHFHCRACAIPAAMPDLTMPGSLVVHYPHGANPEKNSLNSLINEHSLTVRSAKVLTAVHGDYPDDLPYATLSPVGVVDPFGAPPTGSQVLATAVSDWIRNTHAKTKVDSIIDMLQNPICKQETRTTVILSCSQDGRLRRRVMNNGDLLRKTVSSSQLFWTDFDGITDRGLFWSITVRDHVHNMSVSQENKHGGQPLTGDLPIDYDCEVSPKDTEPAAGCNYRNSYVDGGMAVFVEISSPHARIE